MLDKINKMIAAFINHVVTPIASEINNAAVIVIVNQLLKSFNKLILHRFVLKVIFTKNYSGVSYDKTIKKLWLPDLTLATGA